MDNKNKLDSTKESPSDNSGKLVTSKSMKPSVVFHNNLADIAFENFSAFEIKILFAILAQMKNEGRRTLLIPYADIWKACGAEPESANRATETLKRMRDHVKGMNLKVIDDNWDDEYMIFSILGINHEEKMVRVAMNPDFIYLVNDLDGNFTKMFLKGFVKFKRKPSLLLCIQFARYAYNNNSTGYSYWTVDVKELRRILCVPEKYDFKTMEREIIKPALEELNNVLGEITYEKERDAADARKVGRVKFVFRTPRRRNSIGTRNEGQSGGGKTASSNDGYSYEDPPYPLL